MSNLGEHRGSSLQKTSSFQIPQRGYIYQPRVTPWAPNTGFILYSGCYPELMNIRLSGDGASNLILSRNTIFIFQIIEDEQHRAQDDKGDANRRGLSSIKLE